MTKGADVKPRLPRARLRPALRPRARMGLAFSAAVMVGGYFVPELGLAVPLILAVAVISNRRRTRWICAEACPRGLTLSGFMGRFSAYRQLPPFFQTLAFRSMACGVLLMVTMGQVMRHWPDAAALGRYFWWVCVLTFAIAITMALAFKPRSWCAVCPMGTLQNTMAGRRSVGGAA
ncbi:MAG: 4Fe-4S binding protein [Rectinemataceae bacterium]